MRRKVATENPPLGTFEIKSPLSPTEERFFRALEVSVGDKFYIFPKMSLYEVIRNTHQADFERIASKSVDFMLYDRDLHKPICAIELNDKTHEDSIQRSHDMVKMYYINKAGIAFIAMPVYKTFLPKKIRDIILNAKPNTDMEYPAKQKALTVEVEVISVTDTNV